MYLLAGNDTQRRKKKRSKTQTTEDSVPASGTGTPAAQPDNDSTPVVTQEQGTSGEQANASAVVVWTKPAAEENSRYGTSTYHITKFHPKKKVQFY